MAENGSSSSRALGRETSIRASATRWGLPARKLGRAAVFQPLQLEQMDGVLKGGLLFGGVFLPAQAR